MKVQHKSLFVIALALFTNAIFPVKSVIADESTPQIGDAITASHSQTEIQFSGCAPTYLDAVNPGFEQQVVELVNQERAKVGLPPLKRSSTLDAAARYHARDMAEDAYFKHDTYDMSGGALVLACGWVDRVSAYYPSWSWLGENIAAGFNTPESVMQGWMGSPGHKENILNPGYRELGVGYHLGGYYGHYWVQDFATRPDAFPLVISNEKASTDSPNVNLYLYGESEWAEMRLKNDAGAWTAWQPFAESINWTLDWTQGLHTVTVELRKSGQVSAGATSSDNIELTTSGAELGNLPDEIFFIYNMATRRLMPGPIELNPQNTRSGIPLSWQATSPDTWIKISTVSGVTPSSIALIQPGDDALRKVGELHGKVTISVSGGVQAIGSPKEISVHFIAVTDLPNRLYLPAIRH